jgi:anti-anti-sigma regulatory factor
LENPISNVVLNLNEVKEIELQPANALVSLQQRFYDGNHSMVFCNVQPVVYDFLDKNELLEIMNVTPTESEASDIVQMEEIERELM